MNDQFTAHLPVETVIDITSWDAGPPGEMAIESLPLLETFDEASVGQWLTKMNS